MPGGDEGGQIEQRVSMPMRADGGDAASSSGMRRNGVNRPKVGVKVSSNAQPWTALLKSAAAAACFERGVCAPQ